ncbi:type III polyketide synthase [Cellulomonas palmilytica]|uniref:type III polyketide synthase n=1 Tax=Cellulomonas palmilytica TaxID=2608402 RepID=UPI001F1CE806|nr:3-oxoacyl-[acyl-carrier-protein] synthase III C-terminal domain-containing protein [Cellulomonas palmilytica]UJP40336.1 type III polyketide synthase [Cellulomonas palmilytica]
MSRIVAVAPVLPDHVYPQTQIADELADILTSDDAHRAVLRRLHASSGIDTRHLVAPLERYRAFTGFDETNALALASGLDLAERAARAALATAGLEPADVDHLMLTTVTAVGAPSIDAMLVDRLGLRPDVTRLPSFGLGCAGGAAGLARVHDHLEAHPGQVALLVSVELCSLTLQRDDDSTANLVASGLFGDGGAAVVMAGRERDAPRGSSDEVRRTWAGAPLVVGARSVLYPGSADALGWQVGASGLRIVLSGGLPDVVREHVADDVKALLTAQGAVPDDVRAWLVHPGGPKILEAVQDALDLPHEALARSWANLARAGNLSSASVLHVLADGIADGAPPGALGVAAAFGPGVGVELVALRWPSDEVDVEGAA